MRAGLRVVRAAASDVGFRQEGERRSRLMVLLEDWARWSREYRSASGFHRASVCASGCESTDFESMCQQADSVTNRAIDAAVDDLLPAPRAALYRRFGLAAVFRFPRDNYTEQLDAAYEALLVSLPRRGVELDF